MSKKQSETKTVDRMVTDPTVPIKIRVEMIRQLSSDGASGKEVLATIIDQATAGASGSQYVEKAREFAERLNELKQGPLRCGTFDSFASSLEGRRARVILPDGGPLYVAVPDDDLAERLRCGDAVWLDGQAMAVLYGEAEPNRLGEEGRLERVLTGGDVEVSIGELGRYVFRASAQLTDQLADGEAEPGSSLVVCTRQYIAWRALPLADGEGHRRFLSSQAPPDVIVERDVGAPPAFIESIASHIHRELLAPEIGGRFGVRRSQMLLATGVAGSGKSHSIKALWRRIYDVMAEVLGVEVGDLPQRVFQLQASEVLNKWLGESDKNIARFFDEVADVAEEKFVAPDGTEWELPVIVICEEIDALARQRGEDSIHDRIQTTLLTKLDPAQPVFEDHMVVVICTSNIPSVLDVAFVRRAGGTVERFGRVGRFDFRSILAKHLRDRPFEDGDEGRRRAVADLTSWLFAPNSAEPGAVDLTFVGQPNPVTKHRRDFVTAGLIDRAVQQAARGCCNDEWESGSSAWLTSERLVCAIDEQVQGIVDQLTPGNCDQYLTLPDAMRVGTVRRVPQLPVLPVQLERAS
jgi:hypothetical protein